MFTFDIRHLTLYILYMLRLAALFILWPLAELALLIRIGQATSVGTAMALAFLPAILGAALAKREGLKTYHRIQQELAARRIPGNQLIDALLILIAGILLIVPGLISDTLGLLLLIPPVRAFARDRLKRRFRQRFTIINLVSRQQPTDDEFVDVKARELHHKQLGRDRDQTSGKK